MLISLIVLSLGLAPVQRHATFVDYVLNVPLRIENMRNLSSATLNCYIGYQGATATDRQALTTPGTGTVAVPLSGGAFTGTVTATVGVSDANALRYPPNRWNCILVFRWRNPDGTEYNASTSSNTERAAAYTAITGQGVLENTTEISGSIPPA